MPSTQQCPTFIPLLPHNAVLKTIVASHILWQWFHSRVCSLHDRHSSYLTKEYFTRLLYGLRIQLRGRFNFPDHLVFAIGVAVRWLYTAR